MNPRSLNDSSVLDLAQDLILNGIKTHAPDFIIPVIVPREFISNGKEEIKTEWRDRRISSYPPLRLDDKGITAGQAGVLHVINGQHRKEAMVLAYELSVKGIEICEAERIRQELMYEEWKKRAPTERKGTEEGYSKAIEEQQAEILKFTRYLKEYDDHWLVAVYSFGEYIMHRPATPGRLTTL